MVDASSFSSITDVMKGSAPMHGLLCYSFPLPSLRGGVSLIKKKKSSVNETRAVTAGLEVINSVIILVTSL